MLTRSQLRRLKKTGATKEKMERHPNEVQHLLDHVKQKHPKIFERAQETITKPST